MRSIHISRARPHDVDGLICFMTHPRLSVSLSSGSPHAILPIPIPGLGHCPCPRRYTYLCTIRTTAAQYCYYLYSAAYHVSPTNRHCTTRTIRIRIPLYPPTAPTASPDSECVSPASIGLGAYVLCKALTTNAFLVRPPRPN
ncbi:hypothetical protein VTO73DRAFT_9525 [Trametes versicolor]